MGSKLLPVVLAVTKGATALIDALIAFTDSEIGQVTLIFTGIGLAVKALVVVGIVGLFSDLFI